MLRFAETFGIPGLVVLLVFLNWRYPRAASERAAWVFRLEIAVSKDTLVQLFALWRRYVSGRRPPPEESDESANDLETPEVIVRRGPGRHR